MGVKQLLDLTGKVALVTGGSRGIGLQMAEALGEMGARVTLAARRQDELDAARAHLAALGVDCHALAVDVTQPDAPARIVAGIEGHWGPVDILVNNAGTNWGAPAEEYPDDAWRKVMSLNLDAAFRLTREVARRGMIPRRSGKVVNIASISGMVGNPPAWQMGMVAYNASKGALISMTRGLAAEWGRHGINVNAICPGFFPSKMSRAALDRIERDVLAMTPLGRLGGPEDLKGAVVFLASEASRHVTGQALVVDGGCTVV
ncbi:MAG: SDR family oxidoreductase [Betaproteobacteria bacterium]|nr:SDR family oxidoreductase [Betaproteobacteria bacterium]